MPYYAYANLAAYVDGFSDATKKVSLTDKLELFNYLANTWHPTDGVALLRQRALAFEEHVDRRGAAVLMR